MKVARNVTFVKFNIGEGIRAHGYIKIESNKNFSNILIETIGLEKIIWQCDSSYTTTIFGLCHGLW